MIHRFWQFLLCIVISVFLNNCGFHPMYQYQKHDDTSIVKLLAAIKISSIANRTGQILYNNLRDRLNPSGPPRYPLYQLDVTLESDEDEVGFTRDETATRVNYTLTALYTLKNIQTNQILTKGRVQSFTNYNYLTSAFASASSAKEAYRRGAIELSETIRNRLAAFLSETTKP
ncbi:MAG: hypothetical protein K1X44_00730 [Alphaproteobacteria bacterium]|nr:hypothetical protein [Alphaproteobacteria bacterium]